MAASAHQALVKLIESDLLSIKWPNDLLVGERKLAGILAGANPDGSVVVGIGINLSTQSTPDTAIALDELATSDFDSVLASTLSRLKQNWSRFQSDEPVDWLLQYVRDNCSTLGMTVRAQLVTGDEIVGKAVDIQDDGQLVIWADREHVLAAADVWHLRK
jgi:BirA family biotin operon repressor/biotin-[acetyl-CoA-carboxylase] ligase